MYTFQLVPQRDDTKRVCRAKTVRDVLPRERVSISNILCFGSRDTTLFHTRTSDNFMGVYTSYTYYTAYYIVYSVRI